MNQMNRMEERMKQGFAQWTAHKEPGRHVKAEVMQALENRSRRRFSLKFRPVVWVGVICLFTALPVFAETLEIRWHNFHFTAADSEAASGANPVIPADKPVIVSDEPMLEQQLEAAHRRIDLDEANRMAGYAIMRPADLNLPLQESFGTVELVDGKEQFQAYWDIYKQGEDVIYVQQFKLKYPDMKISATVPAGTEFVQLDRADATGQLYAQESGQSSLQILFKGNDGGMYFLEVKGKLSSEQLQDIALKYIPS